MDANSKYIAPRGLFVVLCILLIGASIFRVSASMISSSSNVEKAPPIAQNYQRRFCDDAKVIDHTAENLPRFSIQLSEGCYGPRILIPQAWDTFEIQLSQNAGDYAGLWCNGQSDPKPLVQYFERGILRAQMYGCYATGEHTDDVSVQGRGTITFIRTKGRVVINLDNPTVSQQTQVESPAAYKPTPMLPTSGGDDDYSFEIEECHRSGEQIVCSGKATNKTDARTKLALHNASSVDDEGNMANARMMFPSAGEPYGISEYLMPGVPTNFTLTISDNHQKVRSINLELDTNWEAGGSAKYDELIYKGVPVQ